MNDFTVYPMRVTPDPAPMGQFLADVGLQPVITTAGGGFSHYRGCSGEVAIHGPQTMSGTVDRPHTALNLLTADVEKAATELLSRGVAARWWDESFGRMGDFTDAQGDVVGLNEVQTDTYGYQDHPDTGRDDCDIIVTAVRSSHDFRADIATYAQFGFTPLGGRQPVVDAPGRIAHLGRDRAALPLTRRRRTAASA